MLTSAGKSSKRMKRDGRYLAAERSEDGASGRYTALLGREWSQNHCSNHSVFLTGADT